MDLHPAGATESFAVNIDGGQQVGAAMVDGVFHASLWSGTAASWEDLNTFLPAGYGESAALAILNDGSTITVIGGAFNIAENRFEAIMWTLPIVAITTGACCNRWTGHCVVDDQAPCLSLGLRFDGIGSVCSPTTCAACPADFDASGSAPAVSDIFAFLGAWFLGCP